MGSSEVKRICGHLAICQLSPQLLPPLPPSLGCQGLQDHPMFSVFWEDACGSVFMAEVCYSGKIQGKIKQRHKVPKTLSWESCRI